MENCKYKQLCEDSLAFMNVVLNDRTKTAEQKNALIVQTLAHDMSGALDERTPCFSPRVTGYAEQAKKGVPKPPRTREHIEKLAAANRGLRRVFSSTHRAHLSASLVGIRRSEECKRKISEKLKGRQIPKSVRDKITKSQTGLRRSQEAKDNIRNGLIASHAKRKAKKETK